MTKTKNLIKRNHYIILLTSYQQVKNVGFQVANYNRYARCLQIFFYALTQ